MALSRESVMSKSSGVSSMNLVWQHVRDEGDVGLDAADVLLVDGAARLAADGLEGTVPARDLDEEGVVVGAYLRTRRGVAAVEPDAEAAARAVGDDLAVIRGKVVLGVLGGDAALDGVAVHAQVGLLREPYLRVRERRAAGDEYLGAHDVDARDHLGDGVLDLYARVHLDEVVAARLVHEELDGAGVHVMHGLGYFDGVGVEPLAHLGGDAPGRGELDDLLVAPLEGAVALAEVADAAVLVGEYLDLDVLGLDEVFLHKDAVVAEGLAGLVGDELEGGGDVLGLFAEPHAAPAAACGGFEDDGEAELLCLGEGLIRVAQGHAAGYGDLLGLQLVAHFGEDGAGRADELDAGLLAGAGEGGVFGEEAVAGVDGVYAALFGEGDYLVDGEVGAQGAEVFADEVGLVGLGAEEVHHILFGVDGEGADVEVVAGAEDADGDLAAVGGHDFFEGSLKHCRLLVFIFKFLLSLGFLGDGGWGWRNSPICPAGL